jgi:hypothetical protein
MATSKPPELLTAYRCTACGKVLTDGMTVHWLHCPKGGGRFERVGEVEIEAEEDGQ